MTKIDHDCSPPPDFAVPTKPGLSCLLCKSPALRSVRELNGDKVRRLWQATNQVLSEVTYGAMRPETPVVLHECGSCGFRFFDPALAGGGGFYEDLEKAGYYVTHRPEFDFALQLGRQVKARTILDVGGGEGAFLDLAKAAGLQTLGVELNATAADICARKGHKVIRKGLEAIAPADLGGGVDMLTLFQVIEHVPDPLSFLHAAKRLVRSGGLLVVSVPNDHGLHRFMPFDPANLPPHHVSRWRRADLRQLGTIAQLEYFAEGADVLYGSALLDFWLLHNRLAEAIGRPKRWGGEWLPRILSCFYRKLGCRHYFPRWGLSIYAAYHKP